VTLTHEFENITPLPEIVTCGASEVCGVHAENTGEK
jgi:hypothetical protein